MSLKFKIQESYLVIEAAAIDRYLQMFTEEEQPNVTPTIKWAMTVLEKQDKIIWFLKKYKEDDKVFNNKNRTDFEHFQSMHTQFPKLKEVKFEDDVSVDDALKLLEKTEQDEIERKLKGERLTKKKGVKIVDFPDGMGWWDLKTGGCSDEASAMGHCGNVPSKKEGDSVLSLRKEFNLGRGNIMYSPQLTFIVNNGILGEMKGRANEKPKEKYHKYIVKLLESEHINHIWGGGHAPSNNFYFQDLTSEEQQRLTQLKPDLNLRDLSKEIKVSHSKHNNEFYDFNRNRKSLIDHFKKDQILDEELQALAKDASLHKFLPFVIANIRGTPANDAWVDGLYTTHSNLASNIVLRTRNQDILKDYVNKTKGYDTTRIQAVGKIRDQEFLKNLAITDNNDSIVRAALDRIKDEKFLQELALRTENEYTLAYVFNILKEEGTGADLNFLHNLWGKQLKNDGFRQNTILPYLVTIKDAAQSFLKEIVLSDDHAKIRREAALAIDPTDLVFWEKVALETDDSAIHKVAVQHAKKDQKFIQKLLLTPHATLEDLDVLEAKTDTFWKQLARDSKQYSVRMAAITKIEDQEFLKERLVKENNALVGVHIIEQINDIPFLAKFKEQTANAFYKSAIEERL